MNISATTDLGLGGFAPKLYGTATSADGLNVSGVVVDAVNFLDRILPIPLNLD